MIGCDVSQCPAKLANVCSMRTAKCCTLSSASCLLSARTCSNDNTTSNNNIIASTSSTTRKQVTSRGHFVELLHDADVAVTKTICWKACILLCGITYCWILWALLMCEFPAEWVAGSQVPWQPHSDMYTNINAHTHNLFCRCAGLYQWMYVWMDGGREAGMNICVYLFCCCYKHCQVIQSVVIRTRCHYQFRSLLLVRARVCVCVRTCASVRECRSVCVRVCVLNDGEILSTTYYSVYMYSCHAVRMLVSFASHRSLSVEDMLP